MTIKELGSMVHRIDDSLCIYAHDTNDPTYLVSIRNDNTFKIYDFKNKKYVWDSESRVERRQRMAR